MAGVGARPKGLNTLLVLYRCGDGAMGKWVIAKDWRGDLHLAILDNIRRYRMTVETEVFTGTPTEAVEHFSDRYNIPPVARPGARKPKITRRS